MSVVKMNRPFVPPKIRLVEPITLEQFCLADSGREWASRHVVAGVTILQFPRAIMICSPGGECSMVRQKSTDVDAYFDEALEALDKVA